MCWNLGNCVGRAGGATRRVGAGVVDALWKVLLVVLNACALMKWGRSCAAVAGDWLCLVTTRVAGWGDCGAAVVMLRRTVVVVVVAEVAVTCKVLLVAFLCFLERLLVWPFTALGVCTLEIIGASPAVDVRAGESGCGGGCGVPVMKVQLCYSIKAREKCCGGGLWLWVCTVGCNGWYESVGLL